MQTSEELMIKSGEVFRVALDPIKGSEQSGYRYCVIVSPDSINDNLNCVIIVPLTSSKRDWPTRVDTNFLKIEGQAMCEQIRAVDKLRLKDHSGSLNMLEIEQIKYTLKNLFEN
jgi:mRNA interferase MazF